MLLSICAAVVAMGVSPAAASRDVLIAAEIPAISQINSAETGSGADQLVVKNFTGESVSRDVVKMGVKSEGLAPDLTSGASIGVVLCVLAALVFSFAAFFSSNQGRRNRYEPDKPKRSSGKRRKKQVPF